MKTALFFIANVMEEVQGVDIDQLIEETGVHEDDIDAFLDEDEAQELVNAFLLMLSALGYRISGKDGQGVEYITDAQGYDDEEDYDEYSQD